MGEIVKLIKVKDREPLRMAALFRILPIFREKRSLVRMDTHSSYLLLGTGT